MKALYIIPILLVGFSNAYAIPKCNTGDTCNNYIWSTMSNTFICPGLSCKCRTQTYTCEHPCDMIAMCTSKIVIIDGETCGEWISASTGYEKTCYAICDDDYELGTCNVTKGTKYRCAAGYYGSSTNGTTGCTRCPASGEIYGTSTAGSATVALCYLAPGTSLSDSTGTFEYTENCYYTN